MRARRMLGHVQEVEFGQLTLSELSVHLSTENVEEVSSMRSACCSPGAGGRAC
jgi:hypothetical protein